MTVMQDPLQVGAFWSSLRQMPMLLYIGPDQIMPLTSLLGALVGIALMFWNRLVGLLHKCRSLFTRANKTPADSVNK